MLKNYFIVCWRNISRRPFYSSLNIIGISSGILITLLIGVYIRGELSVNKDLRHASQQYFLSSDWKDPNVGVTITTLGPLAKRLKEVYPGLVANFYRGDWVTSVVSVGGKHFREGIDIGDSTLLPMYGFQLLYGDPATAMKEPYSVVIKKDLAIKYFGRVDVMGQTIVIQSFSNTLHGFKITGVLNDVPENSVTDINTENHHQLFIPAVNWSYFGRPDREDWGTTTFPSYIELRPGVAPADLVMPIRRLIAENAPDYSKQGLVVRPIALRDFYLQKDNRLVQRMLYALSFVGVFILLMAIVNFVNISIGGSAARIKEIGIRKVLGGIRRQIILQFLAESIILVLLSTLLGLMAYPLVKPFFGEMIGKELPGLSVFPMSYILFPSILVLVVGVAAGFYPAIVLSSIGSADSLKGKFEGMRENLGLRKSLTGFQFCLASIVMVAAFIVTQQVSYFFGRDLGYNKEYVVSSQVPRDWSLKGVQHMETVRDQFAAMPEVANVSLSYEIPDGMNGDRDHVYRVDQDSTRSIAIQVLFTDQHYLDTYGIPMKAGFFLNADSRSDTTGVVINESAAKALGWADAREALGRPVRFPGYAPVCTIRGIAGDFHFNSMQQKIPPILFNMVSYGYRYLSFKIRPGDVTGSIRAIEKKWASLLPGSSFEYRFMDDTLKRLYRSEIQLKRAAYVAALLSLVIVLLGVIGLVSLSVRRRTKEIGIRKVLGASVTGIIALFIKDFLPVILISGLIACPLAWILMDHWLDNYAYRVTVTPLPFIISVISLSLVTGTVIVLQTLKAGNANPVKSLKTE